MNTASINIISKVNVSTISKGSVSYLSMNDSTINLVPRRTLVSADIHTTVTAKMLTENFMIGPMRAKATLRAITQRGTSSGILSIDRQYRADRMYNLLRLHTKFVSDTICADKKFLRSNVTSQIYSYKCGFNTSYHL